MLSTLKESCLIAEDHSDGAPRVDALQHASELLLEACRRAKATYGSRSVGLLLCSSLRCSSDLKPRWMSFNS